jgi:hypothetical protein
MHKILVEHFSWYLLLKKIASSALDISYLECVKALDDIEKRSGFVFDLKDKDDVYQFRSQIILDAVRERLIIQQKVYCRFM